MKVLNNLQILSFISEYLWLILIMWRNRLIAINCDYFLLAERLRLIAITINWRLLWQRLWALVFRQQGKSERTSFTWIVLTWCNLEDSCHSTCPTWSDIPPWKVIPPKKDLLGTHLVADFPPDTIVEPIIRISVARIGGQVQLVHLGEGQTIVLADLAHRYVCYMSLRSG